MLLLLHVLRELIVLLLMLLLLLLLLLLMPQSLLVLKHLSPLSCLLLSRNMMHRLRVLTRHGLTVHLHLLLLLLLLVMHKLLLISRMNRLIMTKMIVHR